MTEATTTRPRRRTLGELGRREPNTPTYELFMGFLTILALVDVGLILIVHSPQVNDILAGMDTMLCLIFLVDTAGSWWNAKDRRRLRDRRAPRPVDPDGAGGPARIGPRDPAAPDPPARAAASGGPGPAAAGSPARSSRTSWSGERPSPPTSWPSPRSS